METGLRDALDVSKWDEDRLRELRRTYLAMCAKIDSQAGRLVEALKSEGIYDNTAIIVISDHGDYTGDYGIAEKCQNCFPDCLTNVPFIVKPPEGVTADRGINNRLTELTDLCATVFDLAGVKSDRQSFSESLLPVIKDRRMPHREYVFCEGGRLHGETNCSESNNILSEDDIYAPRLLLQSKEDGTHTKAAMIRSEDYKYVLRLYEKDEFYVLSEGESINRIDDEQYQPVIEKMQKELLLWYMKTCDIVPKDYDERFTAEFLQNNIASAGVPLFIAKTVTGILSLSGKPLSQVINSLRKKIGM
jgi:hypothetical protein